MLEEVLELNVKKKANVESADLNGLNVGGSNSSSNI